MLIAQDQQELRSAYSIQSRCELRRVSLHDCSLSKGGQPEDFEGPFKLLVTHHSASQSRDPNLIIRAQFKFEGKDSANPPSTIFTIECSFELVYELQGQDPVTQIQIEAFKDGNAIFNCWPYVREFVQNMATRMGFQPPPVPLLRIKPKTHSPLDPEGPASGSLESPAAQPSKQVGTRKRVRGSSKAGKQS